MSALTKFNNHLMDGMEFCKLTYALFETIRRAPNGPERIRLRPSQVERKLMSELLPIARFIQAKYNAGRRIKVRWINSSQHYDAYILSSGSLVDSKLVPRRQFLEITTAVHKNDRWAREHLNKEGFGFNVRGVSKGKSGKITSEPYVFTNNQLQKEFADLVIKAIEKKSKIKYPRHTSLVITCTLDSLFMESEWQQMVDLVRESPIKHRFKEILLYDLNFHHFSILTFDNITTLHRG